jgi:hypothetical protein
VNTAARTVSRLAAQAHQVAARAASSALPVAAERRGARGSDRDALAREVVALLAAFRPACPHVAAPIPGADLPLGGAEHLECAGLRLAERAPAGDDGGAYLYLLADGTLAELEQWPMLEGGYEGWIGQLRRIGVRAALVRYPELRPAKLAHLLGSALRQWLSRDVAGA